MEYIEQDNVLRVLFDTQMDSLICGTIEHSLMQRVSDAKKRIPNLKIEFDLVNTEFVGSTFLRFCLYYAKQAGDGKFKVLSPTENVRRIFEITGLTDMINFEVPDNQAV
jgi:anti-anti-sigma factor